MRPVPIRICSLIVVGLVSSLALITVAPTPAAAGSGGVNTVATVKAGDSAYGRILFDGKGFALYAFTRDGRGGSRCAGSCAAAWPPLLVRGPIRPGAGLAAKLFGVTRRADGRMQVTFGGRPLYYYVGERRPGQVLCQNVSEFGGLWLVVRPSGRLVRT
jgi:predicted lipoprotein with Yx(FWY)xxD motif